MSLRIAGRQKKKEIPEDFEGVVHGISQVSICIGARAHTLLSPTSLLQVLGALSPLQASCGRSGEPGQPQVLPQEGCKDKNSFEGTTMLWRAVALSTALLFFQVPFPSPPPQPLCYRTRIGSRASPMCQCLSQSLSLLSLHSSTCQGQETTAPKHGCGCLGCWERAGWNDIFQDTG